MPSDGVAAERSRVRGDAGVSKPVALPVVWTRSTYTSARYIILDNDSKWLMFLVYIFTILFIVILEGSGKQYVV